MIIFICLWWTGLKLTAPDWYYVILIIGLAVRLFDSIIDIRNIVEMEKRKAGRARTGKNEFCVCGCRQKEGERCEK